jgi:predicted ester cyclase
MSSPTDHYKAAVVRFYRDANDARRFELLDELCAPDIAVHDPQSGTAHGVPAFRDLLAFFAQAFPEQRTELDLLVAEGDHVAVLHTHHTVHQGLFNGLPPTGRRVVVPGHELFRFDPATGRIAEFWRFDADLLLMLQLGALPAPSAA